MALTSEKVKREKSPLYPAATVEDCFEFIKIIDKLGGRAVSYSSILDVMGLTSPTTKSFLNRLGASKQYGLIVTGGSTAQLTDIAKKILYPPDGRPSVSHLKECFSNPPLYAKLITRFEGKAIPPKAQLSNLLMNEYGIIKNSKDNAADCFTSSAEYLGLVINGVLYVNDNDINTTSEENPVIIETQNDKDAKNDDIVQDTSDSVPGAFNFEIPTLSGKSARIQIPKDVSEKDLDYIDLYVKSMLPAFIQNLKDELKQE